nr:reverse transcriptase domain-containing protein [Tanacetum cinerariifolium]
AHVCYFNKITSTLKFLNVPNTSIKLMIFPFSLEGAARIWLEKEPPRSIFTWDDLVSKFINQFFPPSKTTNLRNKITNFQQQFDESFSEAWGQIQGSSTSLIPRECLGITESKSKVRYLRNKPVVAKVSTTASTFGISPDVAELKDMVRALLLDKKGQSPAPVKAVKESCVTCRAITTRSGVSYDGPQIPPPLSSLPPVVENEPEATNDTVNPTNNGNTKDVQPQAVHPKPVTSLISEPTITPVSATRPNPQASIPYPSRRNDERNRERAKDKIEKFYQIFKEMSFKISITDALMLMPKFSSTLKALIENKEKLSEMARTPLNEHCSVVLLKKLLEKLGDPGKFLIPYDFLSMAECLALVDLGARINLMPYSVWKRLSLSDLTPTCMTLELVDRSITSPVGIAEDVYVKVGSFHFSADFVVVDFDADPRVPLILRRSFLKTGKALIDMFEEVDAFLAVEDKPTSSDYYQPYLDPEGDILLLEAFLNDDPSPPPYQGNYMPEVCKELKICKAHSEKSSIDKPHVAELKELPTHLEYAFLDGDDKLPVIIAKDLSVEEKTALITILKSHKRAIAWKLSDIKGINPEFCTHKILMEEDFEPALQHQRRVNLKIYDVIKQEVIKLLEAGLIYSISDSPWVSPVQCVPKKGGFTVVENEDNEHAAIGKRSIGAGERSFLLILGIDGNLEVARKTVKKTIVLISW